MHAPGKRFNVKGRFLYDDEFLSMVQKTDFILELALLTIVLCGFCDFLMREEVCAF